jgi:hypothetical protein
VTSFGGSGFSGGGFSSGGFNCDGGVTSGDAGAIGPTQARKASTATSHLFKYSS